MNPYRTREVHPPPPRSSLPFSRIPGIVQGWVFDQPISLDFLDSLEGHSGFKWIVKERKRRIEWARKNKCEPWA